MAHKGSARRGFAARIRTATVGLGLTAGLVLATGGVRAEAGELTTPEVERALAVLLGSSASAAREAIDRVVEVGDTRFAGVFIELLRAAEMGIASPAAGAASTRALEKLTGQSFGGDWPAWVAWYAGTDLAAPPGFVGWKGELLGRIDERFAEVLYAGAPSRIRVEEVVWGGVAYEGIPALDRPKHVAAEDVDYLGDDDPVFGIALGGEARAYPLRIMDWHEMVNDRLGGVDFSIAYCTLCGAGIAYRGRAADGQTYDFGSSGFLMRSNKLMVDRQTRTLWNQFTGRPVLGKLAATGLRLERLPVVVTRWSDWRARHPETRVLSLDTGFSRPYTPGAAYAGYFASPETMFPVRQRSRLLPAKAQVFGLELGGVPKAYPVEALVEVGILHDTVGGEGLALLATGPVIRVDGRSVRTGPARYAAGAAVRAYRTGERRLRLEDGALLDGEGRPWQVTEEALVGPDGARAERLPGHLAYWFGWSSYHPGTLLHGATADDG